MKYENDIAHTLNRLFTILLIVAGILLTHFVGLW